MPTIYCKCECLHNQEGICTVEPYISIDCGGECSDWVDKEDQEGCCETLTVKTTIN